MLVNICLYTHTFAYVKLRKAITLSPFKIFSCFVSETDKSWFCCFYPIINSHPHVRTCTRAIYQCVYSSAIRAFQNCFLEFPRLSSLWGLQASNPPNARAGLILHATSPHVPTDFPNPCFCTCGEREWTQTKSIILFEIFSK